MRKAVAKALGVDASRIGGLRLLKRSVDARKKNDVHFVASYAFGYEGSPEEETAVVERGCRPPAAVKVHKPYAGYEPPRIEARPDLRPVVVGTGPAGLFAAWALAKAGARPLVIERGGCVEDRLRSVARFNEGGPLDPESNIQFGEGGAGTFSDGKLTTNIKNPRCKDVLHIFVAAGAPEEILWQAKPHIGTDLLVGVVRRMREDIIAAGGEVRFDTRLESMRFSDGALASVAVKSADAETCEEVRAAPSGARLRPLGARYVRGRARCGASHGAQAVFGGRAHRASSETHRQGPVRQGRVASGARSGRLQACGASRGRTRRLHVLHVPRRRSRLRGSRRKAASA